MYTKKKQKTVLRKKAKRNFTYWRGNWFVLMRKKQTDTAHMTLLAAGLQVTLGDRIINERNKKSIAMVEVFKKYKIK